MSGQARSYSVRNRRSELLLARLFIPALLLCSALALASCGGGAPQSSSAASFGTVGINYQAVKP